MSPSSPSRTSAAKTSQLMQAGAEQTGLAKIQSNSPQKRQRIRPETRAQMLERLTNPQISLHEASVILRKCPATVRAYCDAGELPHVRTRGGQRRFHLRDVLIFLRDQEAEKKKTSHYR